MGIKMGELMINIYSPLLPQKPQQQASPLVSGLPRKQPRSSNLYVYIQKQFQIGTGNFEITNLTLKGKRRSVTGNSMNKMNCVREPAEMDEGPIKSMFAVGTMIYGYD